MNHLVRSSGAVPVAPIERVVSPPLARAMGCVDEALSYQGPPVPAVVLDEAASVLAEVQAMLRPALPAVIRTWLAGLNFAVSNPLSPEDFQLRASAMIDGLSDLPSSLWNDQTLREAKATFRFFPSASEVRAILIPRVNRLRNRLRELEAVVNSAAPPARPHHTPDAIKHVSEVVGAFIAERAAAREQAPDAKPTATPKHLSDGQLLAIYEEQARQGVQGLEIRIRVLRERVAQ